MPVFMNEEEKELIQIGPATPSGEVFRRYWLPVEVSANLGGKPGSFPGFNNPLRVRVLSEDLVLFRDGSGKPSLLAEHCSHRGTSLLYGRVEENCLRCLYHGWAYDGEGNVIDTPAEPPGSNLKHTVRHPSYPCFEVAGLIFAYLGPQDKIPPFPRYEELFREDGVRLTGNGGRIQKSPAFLQTLDNVLDVWHRDILHGWFKGMPPRTTLHWGQNGEPASPLKYERSPWGAYYIYIANTPKAGVYHYHETHAVFPCVRHVGGSGKGLHWAVPIDDHTTRWFSVSFHPTVDSHPQTDVAQSLLDPRPMDGHANLPDDWVEQVGRWWNLGHPWRQGQIWEDEVAMGTQGDPAHDGFPDWERWHLGTSDRGMMLNHQLWREQIDRVREGLDPIGIIRGHAAEELIRVPAAQFHLGFDEAMRLFNMSLEDRIAEFSHATPHSAGPRVAEPTVRR
ncbi:MAG: aromatic ring-hydroxylating dioxygenase subunit alpha [Chloroflexi bacterium]|nr:aromatic ring-hydroxylating dioxygenase subunit alpha [Chloroflexota bacterium]